MTVNEHIALADLSRRWLDATSALLAPKTAHNRSEIMRVHVLPHFGGAADASAITAEAVELFVAELFTRRASSTVRRALITLRQAYDWATVRNLVSANPCEGVKSPPVTYKEILIFTPDEVAALADAARPRWVGDMILLAYRTGMRRGEVYGLQWGDIDFERRTLRIQRGVSAYAPGQRFVRKPKTKSSRRLILLDCTAAAMLKLRRDQGASSPWVFPARDGGPKCPFYLTRHMRDTTTLAGISHRGFHTLRHSHATWLLSRGIPIQAVSERLGHTKVTTTLAFYAHALPTMQQDIVRVLDEREYKERS
jgi:integrase